MAAFMDVLVSQHGGAVIAPEGKVKASVGQDLVDEPEVVEELESAGL
jgi:hypothetical protein